ncbi:SDR family oxidoreductase [Nibrella saemangeumensis]|uniref:SDR family oxidoreductase n=1 Tax=Nibrella saemangeumensis TaxID=1084526 RepID=A0ABP8NM65_9BACT
MKQTILGAGGAIGIELAKALVAYTNDIRLVSRNPKKVNLTDTLLQADLSDRDQVFTAVADSEIVYLTVGLPYLTKVWQQLWPPLINNVIDACLHHNAKLVYFDTVYAIGGNNVNHITESSPISPTSKKGEVRAEVAKHILDSIEKRNLKAIIARAADFFSGVKEKSVMMNLVYDNLATDKKALWYCDAKVVHSMSYAPDLAKGVAILGNTSDAYNQIWNLPTDPQKITGEDWIDLFATELNTRPKYQVVPGWEIKALGLFYPFMKETYEMRYQYDRDYFFDSSKFNNYFRYTPTTNAMAVKQTVAQLARTSVSA